MNTTRKKQESLVKLLMEADKVDVYKQLVEKWNFSKGEKGDALELAMLELEPHYMKHCREVIKNLLARMRKEGKDYHDACESCGYHSPSDFVKKKFLAPTDIPSIANPARPKRTL